MWQALCKVLGYSREQNRQTFCPQGTYILMEESSNKQMSKSHSSVVVVSSKEDIKEEH